MVGVFHQLNEFNRYPSSDLSHALPEYSIAIPTPIEQAPIMQ